MPAGALGDALRHTEGADAALPHWQRAYELYTDIGMPEAAAVAAILRQLCDRKSLHVDEAGR